MRKIKLVLLPAACWLLFVIFIFGCTKKEDESMSSKNVASVTITTVKRGNIEEIISLTGDIHGQKEVNVYAKVPGKLIKKVKNEGARVKKGQVIALIDRDEEALKFSEAEVKSPIDGIVTMYFADLGEAVFPAQPMPREPVVMIADMNKVKIIVHLSGRDIGKIKKGQISKVIVDAYPDKIFKGRVFNVAPAANPMTRKLKVEILVPNPKHLLKPGTFARVEIITREHQNILTVPRTAVLEKGGEKVVVTVKNNRAKIIDVLTGAEDEKNIEIKKGLKENQKVIIEGNYGLIEGTKVKVTR